MPEELFYIWSNEHKAWWLPNGVGYTELIALAGKYPKLDAYKFVSHGVLFANRPPDETLVPVSVVPKYEGEQHES